MRILSFDPGVGNMGWTILEVQPPKDTVTVIAHGTLVGSTYLKTFPKDIKKKFKDNFLILQAYNKVIRDLISTYKPDQIVSEGVFAYKHVAAAFSLIRCVYIIRAASYELLKKDVAIVAPMLSKRSMTGHHDASKDQMKEGVLSNKNLKFPKKMDIPSEHGFDAIAHGYHYILTLLYPDQYYLQNPKKKKKKKRT